MGGQKLVGTARRCKCVHRRNSISVSLCNVQNMQLEFSRRLISTEPDVPWSPMSLRIASPMRCARSAHGPPVQTATQGTPASAAMDMKASPTTQLTLVPPAAARAISNACLRPAGRQTPRPRQKAPSGATSGFPDRRHLHKTQVPRDRRGTKTRKRVGGGNESERGEGARYHEQLRGVGAEGKSHHGDVR